jgi:hypothetical protein
MTRMPQYAAPTQIEGDAPVDGYGRRGVVLSRDSAHLAMSALRHDAYEMEQRGGQPNLEGAAEALDLAEQIGRALQ